MYIFFLFVISLSSIIKITNHDSYKVRPMSDPITRDLFFKVSLGHLLNLTPAVKKHLSCRTLHRLCILNCIFINQS